MSRRRVVGRTVTSIVPPRLASLPVEWEQLEYSSRSLVFAADGERLLRAWGSPHRPWVLGVSPERSRWKVEAWGAPPAVARTAARELFSLDHRIEEFYRLVRREPVLAGTERRFRGLRLPRDANVYEALLHSIVGQQLSVASANAVKRRLFERTDSSIAVDGIEVPCPPPPARIRALGLDGVRSVGLSGAKSRALLALADWSLARPEEPRTLHAMPLEEAIARLCGLWGVGRWTAENALLRGVGRTDVFVGGDLGIRVALEEYGVLARSAPEERARAWSARHYPGWGSYATLYLWRKLVSDRTASAGG
jgi:DNA-3-methyladenine glycosylase II